LKAVQAASGFRSATTFLTDTQLREAEDAFRRLAGRPCSLLAYLDHALATFRAPSQQKPLMDAAAEYYATKKTAHERTLLSMRQLRSIENELNVTISAEQAAQLMARVAAYEKGEMVPYFALCLFAGILPCLRFGEVSKLKLESLNLETGSIRIEPDVSKVRVPRLVTIQPNLAAWLRAHLLERHPILPPNAVNMHRRICKKFGLSHDVLRHTFISIFVAKYRSMGEAALQAGNSESIIRKHYLDLRSPAEAEQFFGIVPNRPTASAIGPPVPNLRIAV
jgi:integrase